MNLTNSKTDVPSKPEANAPEDGFIDGGAALMQHFKPLANCMLDSTLITLALVAFWFWMSDSSLLKLSTLPFYEAFAQNLSCAMSVAWPCFLATLVSVCVNFLVYVSCRENMIVPLFGFSNAALFIRYYQYMEACMV